MLSHVDGKEGEDAHDDCPELAFGLMLHGLTYPDESGIDMLSVRLWTPVMKHGVIEFIRPEECSIVRSAREMKAKSFVPGVNF